MLTTLLGLGFFGGAAFLGLMPKVLEIFLVLLKAALEGILAYFRTLWKAVSEATYATWTLVLTAAVVGYLWTSGTACTASYGAPKAILQGGGYSSPGAQGGVATTPIDLVQSAKDVFCYWFGCM